MAAKKKTAAKKTKTKKPEAPALPWRLQKLIPKATK